MVWIFQSAAENGDHNYNIVVTAGATINLSYSASVTIGDVLLLHLEAAASPWAITDNNTGGSNVWTQIGGYINRGDGFKSSLWWAIAGTTQALTIFAKNNGATENNFAWELVNFTPPVGFTNPTIDQSITATGNSATPQATVATTLSNGLVVGAPGPTGFPTSTLAGFSGTHAFGAGQNPMVYASETTANTYTPGVNNASGIWGFISVSFSATPGTAPIYVQSIGNVVSGTSASATFPLNNVAGDTIVVLAIGDHSFVAGPFDPNYGFTVTDAQGNVYTALGPHLYTNSNVNLDTDSVMFVATKVKAGPNTVTVTVTDNPSAPVRNTYIIASEYLGSPFGNPVIGFNTNVAFSGDLGVALTTTHTNQGVVLMGVMTGTPPAGFATHANGSGFSFWDNIIAAIGTNTYTITSNGLLGEALWGVVLQVPVAKGYLSVFEM